MIGQGLVAIQIAGIASSLHAIMHSRTPQGTIGWVIALNTVWDVTANRAGGILAQIRARFLSFTMVLAVGFLLLVSLVLIKAYMYRRYRHMSDRLDAAVVSDLSHPP